MHRELLRRRVPQIAAAYLVAGWGLVQFVGFLEERYALAPSWVDLTGLAVLLMLPAILIVAWTHGAPGPDQFNRRQLGALLSNVAITGAVLLAVFGQRDFGTVFETVTVENEDGTTANVERPRADFRISMANFPFSLSAEHMEEEWARAGLAYLLELDLSQDAFLEIRSFLEYAEAARRAGVEDLSRIPRPLQRKIAEDAHAKFFLRGSLDRVEESYVASFRILESESGREKSHGEVRGPDLFTVADALSVEVRRGLGVAPSSFMRSPDQPVADLATDSAASLKEFVLGIESMLWQNDYQTAHDRLTASTQLDPTFAVAQINLFGTASNLNLPDEADEAMDAAMQNAYRLPERLQNLIKANYYFHREEPARGIAVLERWETVHPDDLLPKRLLAFQYIVRGRPGDAARMYGDLLELDPSNGETWRDLGRLHQEQGQFESALDCFVKYTELYPDSADGLVSLATCQELAADLATARETLDRAALLDPNNLSIQGSLGDLQAKTGEFEKAEKTYGDALERARTASERADLLARRLSYYTARAQYGRAIEEHQSWKDEARQVYAPAQFGIILAISYAIYADAGRYDDGLAELEKIKSQLSPPLDLFVSFGSSRLHLKAGRVAEARVDLDQMQEATDNFGLGNLQRVITAGRAELAQLEDNPALAAQLWRESIGDGRARIYQYVGLGRSLRADGRLAEAAAALEEGLRLYPSHGRLNYIMALVQLDRERVADAREYLARALASWAEADDSNDEVRAAREWEVSLKQR